jgi:integrase/recombinase XerC
MTKIRKKSRPIYRNGERNCPICVAPLPAHQTWPGADYRFCGAPECAAKVKKLRQGRYIGPNERKCGRVDCNDFVPEGRYSTNPDFICCSPECWYSHTFKDGGETMTCDCGCGTEFKRKKKQNNPDGLVFLSPKHMGDYYRKKNLAESCGVFREIADEYLEGYAPLRYSETGGVRRALCPFFLYLNEQGSLPWIR